MKICVISNLYEPFARGGAEKVAKAMAEGYAAQGHEVSVISTRPTPGIEIERKNNLTICRFKPMNLFYYLDDYKHAAPIRLLWHALDTFNWHSYFTVKKLLKELQPEIVITHNLKGIGYLLPRLIKQLGIKHCHVLHDVQLSVPSGLIIKGKENGFVVAGFLTRIYEKICRDLFGSPEIIVSPSNWLLRFYSAKGFFPKSKQVVLRNPLLTAIPEIANQLRQKNYRYLFIGQLEIHKGIQWLADLWAKNKLLADLWVAGSGSLATEKISSAGNIKFLGRLNESQLIEVLKQVDFLIVPSLCYENSPTVIQLAFACGIPVVAANIGGAGELVEVGKRGFLFEAGNEVSFLRALNEAVAVNVEKYREMQVACLEASKEFALQKYLEDLMKL